MSEGLRKGRCPGALTPMMARDGLLVRLRLAGGRLGSETARAIAALSEFYGNGLFDLSARANLQLRGISEDNFPPLLDALTDLGLIDGDPEGEAVRNVMASPLAGLRDGFDVTPWVAALEARLTSDPALRTLPGKFGFLIDDGSEPTLAGVPADVRFDFVEAEDSRRVWIGLGGTRDQAVPLGYCQPEEITEAAVWIARTFLSLAANTQPPVRRMTHLIERLGRYQAARAFGTKGDAERLHYSGAIFNRPPVGLHRANGMAMLGLAAPFGRLNHAMLRAAADLADKAGRGTLRLTPWRCVLLPGVAVLDDPDSLTALGFVVDPDNATLRIAACPGLAGCERGTTATHEDARLLLGAVERLGGHAISIHVSGCEKGCAKATRTAYTLVGRDGRYDLVQNGKASDATMKRDLDADGARAYILSLKTP